MASSYLALEAVVRHGERTIVRCLLRHGSYIIGQQKKNEIVIDTPAASARHARLTVVGEDQFFLEDLDSANGTFVDGEPIRGITPITLESEITLGQASLSFERGSLPASIFRQLPAGFLRTSRYAVGKAIVEGRTSTIYEARDTALQRTVALRVLHREHQPQPAQILGFIREVQITAQLTHAGILPVFDFGLDDEIGLYCATRFLEGQSLADLLAGMASGDPEAPHASLNALLLIFLKACDALSLAHSRGVIHGALRPEAIIFGRFGEVFVDHWGFAKITAPPGAESPVVHAPATTATAPVSRYSAPEQAGNADTLDPRADVYALGAVLFRLLTLRDFNAGETEAEQREHALSPRLSPAEALAAEHALIHIPEGKIPERLAQACARALCFAREDRFTDAHDLKKEITAWLECAATGGEHSKIWQQLGGLLGRH